MASAPWTKNGSWESEPKRTVPVGPNKFEIGQELIVPQLYGLLYQAAGEYASTFAITDIVVSGNFGVSRDKVTPAWNQIFTMVSSSEAVIVIDNG